MVLQMREQGGGGGEGKEGERGRREGSRKSSLGSVIEALPEPAVAASCVSITGTHSWRPLDTGVPGCPATRDMLMASSPVLLSRETRWTLSQHARPFRCAATGFSFHA